MDGRPIDDVPPHRREVGLMFQDGALFPHRDVGANVAFGLKVARRPRAERAKKTSELLELVGLAGYERRAVDTLSGGERQRVALARALAPEPRVLLLDEPLASLDGPLRDRLRDDLAELFARLDVGVVYVTHDVGEATALGHRVAMLRAGTVAQTATPEELWRRPAGEWVARFLGMGNVISRNGRTELIRPEAITVTVASGDGNATVAGSRRSGSAIVLSLELDSGLELDAATLALEPPSTGERVDVQIDPAGIVELSP
jgi:thiamine transport system ATP-binding protein